MASGHYPEHVTCPRCGSDSKFPALSRRDGVTYICSNCGDREAYEDAGLERPYSGPPYWDEGKYIAPRKRP